MAVIVIVFVQKGKVQIIFGQKNMFEKIKAKTFLIEKKILIKQIFG